jgi:hypothetical protein
MNTESKEYKKIVKKIGEPLFNNEDKVKSTMFEGVATVNGHPEYNGFVWMYTFEENRMLRLGQEYLRSAYEWVVYDEVGTTRPTKTILFIEAEEAKKYVERKGENWDYVDIKTFQSWYPVWRYQNADEPVYEK